MSNVVHRATTAAVDSIFSYKSYFVYVIHTKGNETTTTYSLRRGVARAHACERVCVHTTAVCVEICGRFLLLLGSVSGADDAGGAVGEGGTVGRPRQRRRQHERACQGNITLREVKIESACPNERTNEFNLFVSYVTSLHVHMINHGNYVLCMHQVHVRKDASYTEVLHMAYQVYAMNDYV